MRNLSLIIDQTNLQYFLIFPVAELCSCNICVYFFLSALSKLYYNFGNPNFRSTFLQVSSN